MGSDLICRLITAQDQSMLPNLKKLHLARSIELGGIASGRLISVFDHTLRHWESVHIKVQNWENYGGDRADTAMLQGQYGERFSFLGDYPTQTTVVLSDAEKEEEENA